MINPNISLADIQSRIKTYTYSTQNVEIEIKKNYSCVKKLNLLWLISIAFYLLSCLGDETFLTAHALTHKPNKTLAYDLFNKYYNVNHDRNKKVHRRIMRHSSNHAHERNTKHAKRQKEYVIEQEKPVFIEKCHIIPNKEQLIITNFYENEPDRNNRIPRQLPVNNYNNKHQHKRKSDQHFIIHPHYHRSFQNLPKDVLTLYKDNLIPNAIDYWQSSLKLKYPYFPIYLGRLCATSQVYYSEATKSVSCEQDCAVATKCGDYIDIPEEHLDVCRYCLNGNDCREKGTKNKGLNADFILYISAINTEHCNISNTVAFASYCQLESKHNRPVAGYVNICPQSVSSKQSDVHSALATLKHEILHALGFSAGLYAFFVDSSGEPLTERDKRTGKPPFNPETSMYEPSANIIRKFTRKHWKISEGEIEREVTLMVTPAVAREVRRHFNCSTLEGAELEDQGEIGTKLTHWEKRVFENEAMTGTYTQNSVFSRITFAFLEDTGWYRVNYSHAEDLSWGKNLGCDFAKKSCKSWIDEKLKNKESIRPYCNNIPNVDGNTGSKYECNSNKDAVLLCNLMRYNHRIPSNYRNFDSRHHQNHLHHDSDKFSASNPIFDYLGGSVILADYCPFMQQVSWSINNETIRDSKCSFEENMPSETKNYVLEEYGSQSKCFLHNRTWQIYSDKCQSRITVSKTIGCYNYKCDINQGLILRVYDQELVCSYKNQIIEFSVIDGKKSMSVYFGNIICPSCEEICGNSFMCPKTTMNSYNVNVSLLPISLHRNDKHYYSRYLNNQHEYCLKKLPLLISGNESITQLEKFPILLFCIFAINYILIF